MSDEIEQEYQPPYKIRRKLRVSTKYVPESVLKALQDENERLRAALKPCLQALEWLEYDRAGEEVTKSPSREWTEITIERAREALEEEKRRKSNETL